MKIINSIAKSFKSWAFFIVVVLLTLTYACSSTKIGKKVAIEAKPIKKAQLTLSPFTYEPTVKNFTNNLLPIYKLQVYTVKNRLIHSKIDTIYRFYHKKSELFIYKSYERELFIAGNIYDDKVVLRNGVKVGIHRDDFHKCFNDLTKSTQDTVRITSRKAINSFYFIFQKDVLKSIKIDNYFD